MNAHQLWQLKKEKQNKQVNFELQNLQLTVHKKQTQLREIERKKSQLQHADITDHTGLLLASAGLQWLDKLERETTQLNQSLAALQEQIRDKRQRQMSLMQSIEHCKEVVQIQDLQARQKQMNTRDKKSQQCLIERMQRRSCD